MLELVSLPNSHLLTNSNLCTQASNYSWKQIFSHMVVGFVNELTAHLFSEHQKYLSLYNLAINYQQYYCCYFYVLAVKRAQGLILLNIVCAKPANRPPSKSESGWSLLVGPVPAGTLPMGKGFRAAPSSEMAVCKLGRHPRRWLRHCVPDTGGILPCRHAENSWVLSSLKKRWQASWKYSIEPALAQQ